MLVWDETDFITCLETQPEIGEDAISHRFLIARDGLDDAIFATDILDCTGVRYVKDQAGERLEFAPANSTYGRYDGLSPLPFGVSVSVKPTLSVRLFSHRA